MNTKIKIIGGAIVALFMIGGGQALALQTTEEDYNLKLLGKYLFFDKLSDPQTQSCSSCHTPSAGWTGGDSKVNETVVAVPGARSGKIGNLRPPSNAYASLVPKFEISCTYNNTDKRLPGSGRPCGGNFWNGRALGDSADNIENNSTTNPKHIKLGPDKNVVESVAGLWDNGSAFGLPIFTLPEQEVWTKYLGATADQAHASPLINPVEQGLKDKAAACNLVKGKSYAALYKLVWGESLDCTVSTPVGPYDAVNITFARFAVALAAYQQSKDVNAFDSKRDRALSTDNDGKFPLDGFTPKENLGHDLFYNTNKLSGLVNPTIVLPLKTPTLPATTLSKDDTDFNTAVQAIKVYPNLPVTNCSTCHSPTGKKDPAFKKANSLEEIGPELGINPEELFTDLSYHNIGSPHNYEVPGSHDPSDPTIIQLAALTGNDDKEGRINQKGMVRVPTLRNVGKRSSKDFVKAYGHNGFFKSLEGIVHFYNTSANRGDLKTSNGKQLEPGAPHTCTSTEGDEDEFVTEKEALEENCWPIAENEGGTARKMGGGGLTGDMGMTAAQEAALVAYLKTLSDIPTPKAPQPFDLKSFHEGALE